MKKQEIMENDERTVAIIEKAKNAAFNVFVIVVSVAIIVLQFLNLSQYVQVLFAVLCLLLAVYWLSYFIIRKKL